MKLNIFTVFFILFCVSFLHLNNEAFCYEQGFENGYVEISNEAELANASTSIHVLLTTIGRPTLFNMLESLKNQLQFSDYLTIVFDALDKEHIYEEVEEYVKTHFTCTCAVIMEPVNLGYWGHAIRNKYNHLSGDFVLHADDDDAYAPDAISMIRKCCVDKSTLYIFKMLLSNGNIIWKNPGINHGYISTQMGAIPTAYNDKSVWAYYYGGDYAFYKGLEKVIPSIEYIDYVIYYIRPK